VGEGVGLGVEQLQVGDDVGETAERRPCLARAALAVRGELGVEVALFDRLGVGLQVFEWLGDGARQPQGDTNRNPG
jgi:hypothetical protein